MKPKSAFISDKSKSKRKSITFLIPDEDSKNETIQANTIQSTVSAIKTEKKELNSNLTAIKFPIEINRLEKEENSKVFNYFSKANSVYNCFKNESTNDRFIPSNKQQNQRPIFPSLIKKSDFSTQNSRIGSKDSLFFIQTYSYLNFKMH